MKNKEYKFKTSCDYDLSIQKVFTSINNGIFETPAQDEISITIYDEDSETVCFIDKQNAIILAEKLLKIANGIKPPKFKISI